MNFVSIRTATLRGDQKITFDIHVQVAGKHIVYLRSGDAFDGARLERLRAKKLKRMWIRPEDETTYLDYVNRNIEMAYDNKSGKTVEARAEVIQGAQQSSAEAVMEAPENQANYAIAKDGAARYVEFLLKEEKAAKSVLDIENADRDLAHHGVAVSTLSVAIAQVVGLPRPELMSLLALGGLLHDIGHMHTKLPLFNPILSLPSEQRPEYMRHSAAGVEVAGQQRHFDPQVLTIIREHEELCDGSGYPGRLQERGTDPLAVIVSTANDFDRLMLNERLSRADTLKKFLTTRVGLHPLNQIQALKSLTI